jgi:hypothetical protein
MSCDRIYCRSRNNPPEACLFKCECLCHKPVAAKEMTIEAQLQAAQQEVERARVVIKHLLLSADAGGEMDRAGHDWAEACQEARDFLAAAPSSREGSK